MLRTAALALIAAAAVDAAAPMPAGIVSRSSVAPLATIAAPMRLRGGADMSEGSTGTPPPR
jgi:hypothetical protein